MNKESLSTSSRASSSLIRVPDNLDKFPIIYRILTDKLNLYFVYNPNLLRPISQTNTSMAVVLFGPMIAECVWCKY